jgi:hypothetical protein
MSLVTLLQLLSAEETALHSQPPPLVLHETRAILLAPPLEDHTCVSRDIVP